MKHLRTIQSERQFRLQYQPPDQFPDIEDTMRAVSPLIDAREILTEVRATVRAEAKTQTGDKDKDIFSLITDAFMAQSKTGQTNPIHNPADNEIPASDRKNGGRS